MSNHHVWATVLEYSLNTSCIQEFLFAHYKPFHHHCDEYQDMVFRFAIQRCKELYKESDKIKGIQICHRKCSVQVMSCEYIRLTRINKETTTC